MSKYTKSAEGIGCFMLPLQVNVSGRSSFILNLNNYRNTHYQALNKAKKNYHKLICGMFYGLKFNPPISIEYTLYAETKRLTDVANVCSIVDKFASDSLVKSECIQDDNFNLIPIVIYGWGGVDKDNPRVEMRIKELTDSSMCGERWIETGKP